MSHSNFHYKSIISGCLFWSSSSWRKSFLRFGGVANRSSKATAYCYLDELTRKCMEIKHDFMHVPTIDEMEENARIVWNKYALKNVIGGIDGMMIPMTNLRSLPLVMILCYISTDEHTVH